MSEIFEQKVLLAQEKIQQVTQQVDLPTLPSIYNQLRTALTREDCTFEIVADIIHRDPTITLKILKIVNSAAFGFNTEIKQIQSAVRLMGFGQLSHLILGLSVLSLTDSLDQKEFNYKRFWEHSIAVGIGARILIKRSSLPSQVELEDVFVAGLLHDIGKLINERYFSEKFHQAIEMCKSKRINLSLAEEAILGFNHQHIGALMLREWRLPKVFEHVAANHHHPIISPEPDIYENFNQAVHLSNSIAKALSLGSGGDPFVPEINYEAWERFNIPLEELPKICQEIRIATKELYHYMF